MPIDCQLYFGASPTPFRSKPFRSFLTELPTDNMRNKLHKNKMPLSIPLRPILMRPDPDCSAEDSATSPTKLKKRVMFADEKGNPLTEIKWMSEPSNFPPQWDDSFVEQVTKGASAAAVPTNNDKWEVAFTQPVSDYIEFRTKLEKYCVSIENVMIKHSEEEVVGTIKVKNLAFDKIVFLRVTYDSWKSFEDILATHVPSVTAGTSVYELFDTFSFKFTIPERADKITHVEFCVCFRCNETEFWDSNNGANYKLNLIPGKNEVTLKKGPLGNVIQFESAFQAKMENWTEFASWQHLLNDSPYW